MARRSTDPGRPARDGTRPAFTRADGANETNEWRVSARLRILLSVVVIYHLLAVFIGAWIGSPPTSPLADVVARPFRAYIAAADLNHGYRFFAPNPGPSHLFRYRLTHADGTSSDGFFPDRNTHWPRLLYHRYFMLSENLNVLRPGTRPDEPSDSQNERLLRRFRALADSYAAELLRTSGAARIEWEFVRHYQPSPDDVLAGRAPTDSQFYETLERGSLVRATREESP